MSSITTSNSQHLTHGPNKSVAKLSIQENQFFMEQGNVNHSWNIDFHCGQTSWAPQRVSRWILFIQLQAEFVHLWYVELYSGHECDTFNTRAQPYKRAFRQSSNFHAFKKTSPFQTTFKPVYLVWNRNRWNNWF